MKSTLATACQAVIAVSGLLVAGQASAQSTWDLTTSAYHGSSCAQTATNKDTYNNSYSCGSETGGSGGTNVKISGWSTDRGIDATGKFTWSNGTTTKVQTSSPGSGYVNQSLSGTGFANSWINAYGSSGFGSASRTEVKGAGSPDHSFDSYAPGTGDMMLLDFGSTSVVLDKIGIGWKYSTADITLMRWTGTAAPSFTNGTSAVGGLQNLTSALYNAATPTVAGWQLVGSYQDLGTDSYTPYGGAARSTGATAASSWWLVSTFNTTLNGGSNCLKADGKTTTTCDGGDDSFKLNYLSTTIAHSGGGGGGSQVPEPATLALVGAALIGMTAASRRRPGLPQISLA